jgi:hypothetical protein
MDLSYVGLVELLRGVEDDVVSGLPAPQARVLRVVQRREEPDEVFDRLSLSVAVVEVLRGGRLRTADAPRRGRRCSGSIRRPPGILSFVVRRLGGTPTRIAVVRSSAGWSAGDGEPTTEWLDELMRGDAGRARGPDPGGPDRAE